jgi:alpha-amylase/alpha-mannosidase (GH57 family)
MQRNLCIHGHFYQPPRENPWLEAVELQDSAYPYHDWNERITAECYASNAVSRILDGENRIQEIVNNYAKISFNFGPTLLRWLEEKAPDVHRAIQAADQESCRKFSGHGSAIAQAYNHMIMPLANRRDKQTQVLWGIRDFEYRFGRRPEGMWLPETAVDLETLQILAEHGIRFTILSPHQARRMRLLGARGWRDARGGRIDPSTVYRQRLRAGAAINLFFYDGPISRALAFENLLIRGEDFAERLLGAFSEKRTWPQLVHVATDGETYGHHRRFGDMALAYALRYIESKELAKLTNYGEYLEHNPPLHEVGILERTSWSCVHGIERWRSDCGCNSGGHPGWNQAWRAPLREALDFLRDALIPRYEKMAKLLLKDPWAARDDYIEIILNRSAENVDAFFRRHATHELSAEERVRALKLLELQRHAMLMYTSCGWFFDELSGLETVQVMQYAGRAVQLSQELSGDGLEEQFLEKLAQAKSNLPDPRDGRNIYEKFVRPARVDLSKVGAHYAVSSLFEDYADESETYCYRVRREDYKLLTAGQAKLALGRATITSNITTESATCSFGVLHLGDQNIRGGIRDFRSLGAYEELGQEVRAAFERGDLDEVGRIVEKNFESGAYTLKLLFRDEQRKILRSIVEARLAEVSADYRRIYEGNAPLMRFMTSLGIPLPKGLQVAAEFTLNDRLAQILAAETIDKSHFGAALEEAKIAGVTLDETRLEFTFRKQLDRLARGFQGVPRDPAVLEAFRSAADLLRSLPFEVNLWTPQNCYHAVLRSVYPQVLAEAGRGEEAAHAWVEQFRPLGEILRVRIE